MTPTTLGIDLGTSGVRAVLLTPNQEPAIHTIPLTPSQRRDPAQLWSAVTALLDPIDLSQVEAIAVDGTSGTLLAIRADNTPATALSLYNDPPDPIFHNAVAAQAPPDSIASALPRALALLQAPGAIRILHEADWITAQLSGRFDITDENNALKTGYDPIARHWPAWLQSAGLPPAKRPTVLPAGASLGPITPTAARQFGLPAHTLIAAGTTDGCASFLATGAHQQGDAVTALGSTTTLKLLAPNPIAAPQYGIYSHRLNELWLPGGASNAGGAVLSQFFTQAEIEALSKQIDPTQPSPLDYLPLPAPGDRFPTNDPALQPRLTPRPTNDADFLHALLEGIARIEAQGYQRLVQLGAPPIRRVLTTGGGARNPAWTAIRTRLLGVPVHPAPAEAALGAAILARSALPTKPASSCSSTARSSA